MKSLQNFILWW